MSKLEKQNLTKLYYSIGEVADIFGVNPSLIRFWEKEFPKLSPKKNAKGNRKFTVDDIVYIDKIYQLVKEEGYTLEGAKKALNSKKEVIRVNNFDKEEIISRLEKVKDRLLALGR